MTRYRAHSLCAVWIASTRLILIALLTTSGLRGGSVEEANHSVESTGRNMVVVVGASGTDEYGRSFDEWADRWVAAADTGGMRVTLVGRDNDQHPSDRDRLQAVLTDQIEQSAQELWLVLIGHGTFDGRQAQFNLRGDDVSAGELAEWLQDCRRPLALINCASASAPFIDRLSGPQRVVMTATKSGSEENFTRFGDYLSAAIADFAADLDKDGQVSLLEAFLRASRQTQAYYNGQRLLATEHALLEDNGDARGVRASFFAGLRPTTQAAEEADVDGLRAHQWHLVLSEAERNLPAQMRKRRNELELELATLRQRKDELDEDNYYGQIEPILLQIARLYSSLDDQASPPKDDEPAAQPSIP